jgi:hypothetical protein
MIGQVAIRGMAERLSDGKSWRKKTGSSDDLAPPEIGAQKNAASGRRRRLFDHDT